MKNNWQTKKLGEVCDFSRGLTYSKSDEVDFSGSVVLRANNIELDNTLNLSDLKYIQTPPILLIHIVNIANFLPLLYKKISKGSTIIC